MKLRINKMVKYTVVDGHGLRLSIFTQGCEHKCEGCHNPQTHDKVGGYVISIEEIITVIKNAPYITGVAITGGDPLFQYENVVLLCQQIKAETSLDIVVYTGYTYEQIEEKFPKLLKYVDFVVDGRYEQSLSVRDAYFIGSTNQRYIDVAKTKETGEVIVRFEPPS